MGEVFEIRIDDEGSWVAEGTEILLDRITVISGEDVNENSFVLARCMEWFRERELSVDELKSVSFPTVMKVLRASGFPAAGYYVITEPERSLHPVQIVECAREIVSMSMLDGTRFIMTTYCPDMVSGVRYISERAGILSGVRFYLSERDKYGIVSYRDCGQNVGPIFKSFNKAIDLLSEYGPQDEEEWFLRGRE